MMTRRDLLWRGLAYYWRTHLAVAAGAATAVAVLAGALVVGDSVRGSLRDLALGRLGRADFAVLSTGFFREALADDLRRAPAFAGRFGDVTPLIIAPAFVTAQVSGRRAGQVMAYGVDDRFWRFHGVSGVAGPADGDGLLSPALAGQLGLEPGDAMLVRVERPTDVPLESLHGRKDDLGRTLRLTVRATLPVGKLGEFSLAPQQAEVRAVFVPLSRLQRELEARARVNALLVSSGSDGGDGGAAAIEAMLSERATLADVGLTVRALESRGLLAVGSEAGVLDDRYAAAVFSTAGAAAAQPVFTYLANTIRARNREIPYSLVTAIDLGAVLNRALERAAANDPDAPPIVLTTWAAADLGARVGEPVTLDYYVWEEPGRLVTRSAAFRLAAIAPIEAGDSDLAPTFAGITDSASLADWDPPFPIDLRRVRPEDEDYWTRHRTTPKAYIPLDVGQRLWGSRYGRLTSVRVTPPAAQGLEEARLDLARRLRAAIDPAATGLEVRAVRAAALDASRGATDFGAYFLYFSFFIVVSALVLVSLFFKLGVEQRAPEVGLLRAVGFGPSDVGRLFLGEGLLLSLAGSVVGAAAALGYAALIIVGLGSWWVDAVGTRALTLHVGWPSLALGAVAGVASATCCIWWTLRSLKRVSERSLLAGQLAADAAREQGGAGQAFHPGAATSQASRSRPLAGATAALLALGVLLVGAGGLGWVPPAGAFFGAAAALLCASLCGSLLLLRRRPGRVLAGTGWVPVSRLGLRGAAYRPARSVLSMAVIASATFVLVSVEAFRRGDLRDAGPRSGVGGYALLVETVLPVVQDPNTPEGRDALGLFDLDASVQIEPLRLRPGDDASCLNLYAPTHPRILGVRSSFLAEGRFVFADSLAATEAERANPWLLLERTEADGAIPVAADANSLAYVLHRRLGDDIVLPGAGGDVRLRIVAALRDSVFQSELVMSEASFLRAFPEEEGYRVLLVEAAGDRGSVTADTFEEALMDFGADAVGTAERLAQFHRVANTYLSTFQALGGLGLLLGTIGLGTVLLRNVLERRRELALLGAVGFRPRHVAAMVLAENALLLAGGLASGVLCAWLAIAPALAERGSRLPFTFGGAVLVASVFLAGLLSSVVALRAAIGMPLLATLRSE
jgi:hypothetical protein